ncbi:hypothetical protein Pcinc_010296 [Petrolisthes cinctipes]|uniref:F5/8 type C domain-containing protein n=1 Tax=Petrolisthes cinctipes TaxID=88211 RepID=A0AAE1KNZ1_PETCI|nr:hypothetical protein Pcinc_017212 [Petrolisthes cinctipes]KAK3885556.1 hypothetical protein Pcinc_010296 [Petrolisthes cinctipes]
MSQDGVQWCRVWVTMLLLLPSAPVEGGELRLMRSVLISLQRVQAASKTEQEILDLPPGARPALYCSNKCTLRDWCQLWCAYPSNTPTHCLVSNIIVMPTYQETNMGDVLTCHTTRPKDLATNTNITAGKHYVPNPLRVKENLVDGFYNYDLNQCFYTEWSDNDTWFTLDFGQPKSFQHVILYAQVNRNAKKHFNNVQVRVSNVTAVTPPEDFAAYDLFGEFPGEASPGQVVEMKSPKPMCARFVTGHMLHIYLFQVCHIEVF